jgi:C-terminal processing protease CtpA/Prc
LARRLATALVLSFAVGVHADQAQDTQRRGREMLDSIESELRNHYYDPRFHGVDLSAHFDAARERMKAAPTESAAGAIVAQSLRVLHDSHTYFMPPPRPYEIDYGFELRMIGDICRIVSVDKDSDAEKQGLVPGLAVVGIEGVEVTRAAWPEIEYALFIAQPRRELRLRWQAEGDAVRATTVAAKLTPLPKQMDAMLWFEAQRERRRRRVPWLWQSNHVGDIHVIRLSSFDADDDKIAELFRKFHQAPALVLDLRGNPGGWIDTLRLVAGSFFDHDVEIATEKERKGSHALRSRRSGSVPAFKGKLVALVDSASGSCAELLARTLQLEGRAQIVGDTSAGAVMESEVSSLRAGNPAGWIFYAVSVTRADLVMKDGQSLEGRGVVPDETVLPSARDLKLGHDPALARAVTLLGGTLTTEAAGALFKERSKTPAK